MLKSPVQIVEGKIDSIGTSVFHNQGPGVREFSQLKVGGTDIRNVWAWNSLCNFEIGDSVRILFARRASVFSQKWDMLAIHTPTGRFGMGLHMLLLLFVCLLGL